jgi:hypothetical protein
MNRRALACFPLALGGLWLLLFPLSAGGQAWPPRAACPPFPAQGPAGTVAVYAATALDVPGVICLRAVNGMSQAVGLSGISFFLRKWEEGTFRNFSPDGMQTGGADALWQLPGGKSTDAYLFAGQPATPGRYRACLRYLLIAEEKEQVTCSEEFSLL